MNSGDDLERIEVLPRDVSGTTWKIADREFDLLSETLLLGVLNLTPDSFYDGGRHAELVPALAQARRLVAEGAAILDVGAESTRPGAEDVPADEQLRRLLPVVDALVADGILVSVDTRDAVVARAVLERGVAIINDVSTGCDPRLLAAVADHDAACILMHARGTPQTMQKAPRYDAVTREVGIELEEAVVRARDAGVDPGRIAVDPGIGFGKRPQDNVDLLLELDELIALGCPVVLGVSRKSFLGTLGAGETPDARLAGSLAASVFAYQRGVRIFRTHDVGETRKALAVLQGLDERLVSGGEHAWRGAGQTA